ncbi:MAG: DUF6913 domain-containing protein [Bacteroidales bacterium]
MKIIQNIREKFAKSFLLNQQHEMDRKQKQVNLDSARSLVLLYYLPDEATYKVAESIVVRLSEMNLKVRVVCFTDLKIVPHYFIPKISQDIFTAKDLNWRYQPQKPFVKDFIETEYDILIDLSLADHLPLLYCAALSRAGIKVGRFQEDHQLFYDLMIHLSTNETIDSFTEQVIHYLSRINN